jgi:hypothetical protein
MRPPDGDDLENQFSLSEVMLFPQFLIIETTIVRLDEGLDTRIAHMRIYLREPGPRVR